MYKSGNELPTQGGEVKESVKSIYENAEWKLKPSKDVYHIWIDQYIENTEAIIEPVELFRLIDQTSGTEFIVSLTDIDLSLIHISSAIHPVNMTSEHKIATVIRNNFTLEITEQASAPF